MNPTSSNTMHQRIFGIPLSHIVICCHQRPLWYALLGPVALVAWTRLFARQIPPINSNRAIFNFSWNSWRLSLRFQAPQLEQQVAFLIVHFRWEWCFSYPGSGFFHNGCTPIIKLRLSSLAAYAKPTLLAVSGLRLWILPNKFYICS